MITKKTGTIPYGPVSPILEGGTDPLRVTWYPDETYVPALMEAAASQGLTPQHVATDVMSWGISQGWSYTVPPDVSTVFFSQADMKIVREALGNPEQGITGAAIAALVRAGKAKIHAVTQVA